MSVDSEGSTGNPTNFGTACSVTTGTGPDAVALDAPAKEVFVANSGGTLTVIPTTTCNQSTTSGCSSPTQVPSGGHLNAPSALAVSGSTLYVGNGNGTVAVYNAGTNTWWRRSTSLGVRADGSRGRSHQRLRLRRRRHQQQGRVLQRDDVQRATTSGCSSTPGAVSVGNDPVALAVAPELRQPLRGQRGEWGRDLGHQLEHPRGASRPSPTSQTGRTAPAWSSPSASPRTATRSLPS